MDSFIGKTGEKLSLLEDDETKAYIGRKKSIHSDYGSEGALLLGKSVDEENYGQYIYLDAVSPHVVGITGARGSGKCLKPDEKVLIGNGELIEIKKIFKQIERKGEIIKDTEKEKLIKSKEEITVPGINKDLKTDKKEITHAYRKKVDEDLINIKTKTGKEITVTKEHPLLTIDGKVKWKEANEVDEEEYIALPRKYTNDPEDTLLKLKGEKVVSGDRSQEIAELLCKIPEEGIELKELSEGRKDHIWRTARKAENRGLVQLKQNSPLKAHLTLKGKEKIDSFNSNYQRLSNRSKPIQIPEKIDTKFAKFLAYIIAEGTDQNIERTYRTIFTNQDKDLIKEYKEICKDLFGLTPKETKTNDYYIDSRSLEKILEETGFETSKRSREKDIPNSIIRSDCEIVKNFLRTYSDCEGYVSKDRPLIEISTASKRIANKLSYLFLRFGIQTSVKKKKKYATNTKKQIKRNYYSLEINGKKNLEKFKKEVDFSIQEKSKRLEKHLQKKSNPNFDVVPKIGSQIKELREALGIKGSEISTNKSRSTIFSYEREDYFPSRRMLLRILDNCKDKIEEMEKIKENLGSSPTDETIIKAVESTNITWTSLIEKFSPVPASGKELLSKIDQHQIKLLIEEIEKTYTEKIEKAKEKIKQLKKLARSHIYWDKIVEIKKISYQGYVYDLTVKDNHNFIAGKNGGIICHNSYSLGCIAEELTIRNPNVASIIIDPIGIYWSMKDPNKENKEIEMLGEWGLNPRGIKEAEVFIPRGMRNDVPSDTYDKLFSIRPEELTTDDWCLTFNIKRFSPTGLLLEKTIEKTKKEKGKRYGIEDLIETIKTDEELVSKEEGYTKGTRRALISRFEAAKNWGVLSKKGTSLAQISQEGKVSVVDTSFLEENVAAMVIGILARKILSARKIVTRKAAMDKYNLDSIDQLMEVEIPPTWLFIDEAHTLMPSGSSKTAASEPLIEYVKQGRRPGCSLVFATQQPSAIDTKVLSQLDIMMSHKLIFDEDINKVRKRMPTKTPKEYNEVNFFKNLPVGVALVGDRAEKTSRAFPIKVRPRLSQHEGRETQSVELDEGTDPEKLKGMISNLVYKKVRQTGEIPLSEVEETTDLIQRRYDTEIDSDEIIDKILTDKNCNISNGKIYIPKFEEKQDLEIKGKEVKAFKPRINKEQAKKLANKQRKKKKLGLFGEEEEIKELELDHEVAYKINYEKKLENGFKPLSLIINDRYEVYYLDGDLKKTNSLEELLSLNQNKMETLKILRNSHNLKELVEKTDVTRQTMKKYINELKEKKLIRETGDGRYQRIIEMPEELDNPKINSIETRFTFETVKKDIETDVDEDKLASLPSLYTNCNLKNVEPVLIPIWRVKYTQDGEERTEKIQAI